MLIETAGAGEVVVAVEVADSADERQVGLMGRESLPEDAGMIFLFDEDTSGGFWMKDTLIPLSIAFADADGTIVSILDMEPCEADPCEIYDPGVLPYRCCTRSQPGCILALGRRGGRPAHARERRPPAAPRSLVASGGRGAPPPRRSCWQGGAPSASPCAFAKPSKAAASSRIDARADDVLERGSKPPGARCRRSRGSASPARRRPRAGRSRSAMIRRK